MTEQTTSIELMEIAEAARAAANKMDKYAEQIQAQNAFAEKIGEAWSGSYLGYQSCWEASV